MTGKSILPSDFSEAGLITYYIGVDSGEEAEAFVPTLRANYEVMIHLTHSFVGLSSLVIGFGSLRTLSPFLALIAVMIMWLLSLVKGDRRIEQSPKPPSNGLYVWSAAPLGLISLVAVLVGAVSFQFIVMLLLTFICVLMLLGLHLAKQRPVLAYTFLLVSSPAVWVSVLWARWQRRHVDFDACEGLTDCITLDCRAHPYNWPRITAPLSVRCPICDALISTSKSRTEETAAGRRPSASSRPGQLLVLLLGRQNHGDLGDLLHLPGARPVTRDVPHLAHLGALDVEVVVHRSAEGSVWAGGYDVLLVVPPTGAFGEIGRLVAQALRGVRLPSREASWITRPWPIFDAVRRFLRPLFGHPVSSELRHILTAKPPEIAIWGGNQSIELSGRKIHLVRDLSGLMSLPWPDSERTSQSAAVS